MTHTRVIWFASIIVILSVVFAVSRGSDDQNALLSQLQSTNWHERSAAAEKLIADAEALGSDEVRKALIDLLERENQLIDSTLRESGGQEGVSVKYGEAYSEYYARLLGAVDQVADFSDKRTLDVLARGSYNPDSPFALRLASYGEAVVPMLVDRANSDVGPSRATALAMLGEILMRDKRRTERMPADTYEQAKRVLQKGVVDEDVGARIQAVRSIGKVGDRDSIPLLESIAKTDPAAVPSAEPGTKKFPVREEALKALSAIKSKEPNRQM